MTLTRFNIKDQSTDSNQLQLSAHGFVLASVRVDSKGKVWMAWGRILVKYDPDAKSKQSWSFPDSSAVAASAIVHDGTDGNAIDMTIAGDNEVWVATHGLQALFGFNPTSATWDKTISLPLTITLFSRIEVTQTGNMVVNGSVNGPEPNAVYALALVNLASRVTSVIGSRVRDFAMVGDGEVVYVDDAKAIGRIDLSNGAANSLVPSAPVNGIHDLAADASGNVWFSMIAYKSVGVGKVDLSSGAVSVYPFPQPPPATPGQPGPVLPCPGPPCPEPGSLVFDPGLQSIVIDASHNVWVLTAVAGPGGDPTLHTTYSALYELAGAA